MNVRKKRRHRKHSVQENRFSADNGRHATSPECYALLARHLIPQLWGSVSVVVQTSSRLDAPQTRTSSLPSAPFFKAIDIAPCSQKARFDILFPRIEPCHLPRESLLDREIQYAANDIKILSESVSEHGGARWSTEGHSPTTQTFKVVTWNEP